MFTDAPSCSTCTRVLDPAWIDPAFQLAKRNLDLSTTYDGCEIASKAFAEFCERVDGVSFVPIPSEPDFMVMRVNQLVRVDAVANGTRFDVLCNECEQPRFVSKPGPLNLADGEQLPRGLSRTDVGFGDTADFGVFQPNHLGGAVVADENTGTLLNGSGMRGVHAFQP